MLLVLRAIDPSSSSHWAALDSDSAALTAITKGSVAAKEWGVLSAGVPPAGPPTVAPTGASQPHQMVVLQTVGEVGGDLEGGRESTSSITADQQREQPHTETDRQTQRGHCLQRLCSDMDDQPPSDTQQSALPSCTLNFLNTFSLPGSVH